ncbi:MAG: class I SAM-dependent methyltransferase [Sphingobacteriales bacterium]|nr:class I SAM-dependent methyltransferase [Sphingobacteriales bacterium]
MKIKLKAENPLEWLALKLNLAPLPLVDTQIAFTAARAIMAAAELGIYEAIGKNAKSADEVAKSCNTHPHSTAQLLNCLVGIGYLNYADGNYSLKPSYHKWLLKENESNIIGKLRFQLLEWNWVGQLEDFVRTGKPLDLHSNIKPEEWELYQDGMRDLSVNAAKELAGKIPIAKGSTRMLDIGGSHGLYSIELCKKHPGLTSTILELPGAIESASSIAKRYDTSGSVSYQSGNALTDDLGTEQFDLVMINNVVHHFTPEQNKALAQKIAKALKPGGIYSIGELIRAEKPGDGGIMASTTGLYFSLTSSSGNWSESEISSWQKAAGLKSLKPVSTMSMPGWKMIMAQK